MTDDVYNARKNENFDNFCKLLIKITEDYRRLLFTMTFLRHTF